MDLSLDYTTFKERTSSPYIYTYILYQWCRTDIFFVSFITIYFPSRGRLKRRGPADTAYTSDKLKELNTRRPYPFLYGLLSSMQYRHTHHHPYKHLVAGAPTTTDPDGRPLSSDPRQPPMSQASDTGLWHGPFSSRHPPQSSAQRVQGIGVSLPSQPGTLQPQAFHDNRANQTPQITISNSSIRQHGNPNMCVQQNHNIGLPQSTFYHDMDNNVIVSSNQQCGGNDKFTASWGVTSSGFPRTQIPMSSAPYVAAQCSNWTSSGTTPNTSQNFGFERQIEHFGSLPEFPDITTGLYAYPSPTCW